jgi:hypothetical protein
VPDQRCDNDGFFDVDRYLAERRPPHPGAEAPIPRAEDARIQPTCITKAGTGKIPDAIATAATDMWPLFRSVLVPVELNQRPIRDLCGCLRD